MPIWAETLALLCGGVIGGFISGQRECREHKVRLPGKGRKVELGIVGDILIGAAASLATYGIVVGSNLVTIPQENDPHWLLKLTSIGIITGFTGIQLLSGISSRLVRDVQGVKDRVNSLEQREESLWMTDRADSLREHGRYEEAERGFNEALKLDPDNDLAVVGLAKVYRWSGRVNQAIHLLTEFIDRKPSASRAIYNRACYKALLNQRREAIADLKWAIQIDPYYLHYAQKDTDFADLRDDPEFPDSVPDLNSGPRKLRERPEEAQENV